MITLTPDELRALIEQYGEPAVYNKEGGISRLNDIFWAALYAKTREKIILEQLRTSRSTTTIQRPESTSEKL